MSVQTIVLVVAALAAVGNALFNEASRVRFPLLALVLAVVLFAALRRKTPARVDPDPASEIVAALRALTSGEPRARWAAAEALESRIDPDAHPLDDKTAAALSDAVPLLSSMATDGNAVPVQRTAVMILGQLTHSAVGPVLLQVLRDEENESHVRYEAIRGLDRIGYEPAVADLILALRDETLVDAARPALQKMKRGSTELLEALEAADAAAEDDDDSSERVLGMLAQLADPATIEPLVRKTRSSSIRVRAAAAQSLTAVFRRLEQARVTAHDAAAARDSSTSVVTALEPLLSDRAEEVRIVAFECPAWPLERMVAALSDADETVRRTILRAMQRFGEATMPVAVQKLRGDSSENVRAEAAYALSRSEDAKIIAQVLPALADASPIVRSAAAKAVARVTRLVGREHDETVIAALELVTRDQDDYVSRAATEAIDEIRKRLPWQGDATYKAKYEQMMASPQVTAAAERRKAGERPSRPS